MPKRPTSRRRDLQITPRELFLENLENRTMLAGNVLASVTDGTLNIDGDDHDNSILVSSIYDGTYGHGFRVEGFDNYGPTTVNGYSYDDFFGVTNILVNMNEGDDQFGLTNDLEEMLECLGFVGEIPDEIGTSTFVDEIYVPGWVVIKMGEGDNQVGVGGAEIERRLLIQGGGCEDAVGICDVKVGANLVVQTFGDDDLVVIYDTEVCGVTRVLTANGDSEVEIDDFETKNLLVRGGNHEDCVIVSCFDIEDDLVIQTLAGEDDVEVEGCFIEREEPEEPGPASEGGGYWENSYVGDMLLIQTGLHNSEVDVDYVTAGQVNILGGTWEDDIDLQNLHVELNIVINTLDDEDYVSVFDTTARSLIINTHGGGDSVEIGGNGNYGSAFSEDVIITTGNHGDRVWIGLDFYDNALPTNSEENFVNIGDDLIIDTGDDTDRVEIFNYAIGHNVVINTGAGDDSGLEQATVLNNGSNSEGGVLMVDVEIGHNFTLNLGTGVDGAELDDVDVGNNAIIDAGPGDDGSEILEAAIFSNAGIRTNDLDVLNNLWVFLGEGEDTAFMYDSNIGNNAYIHGGGDDDSVELDDFDVDENLFVYMEGGDDYLSIEESSAEVARVYGGSGDDWYSSNANSFGDEFVYSFE